MASFCPFLRSKLPFFSYPYVPNPIRSLGPANSVYQGEQRLIALEYDFMLQSVNTGEL